MYITNLLNVYKKSNALKVVSATFLLVCFSSLKESTYETRKMFFISLRKLFSFPRKSNFRFLDYQILWRYQMPKHKTRNTFYWITWEVNTVCLRNLASLCHIIKKKIIKTFCKNCNLKTSSRPFFVCKEFKQNLYWKLKFLKQATYIRYVIAELSKSVQISMQTSSDCFL